MLSGQENRFIRFVGQSASSLVLLSLEGKEQLSAPYDFTIRFRSTLTSSETASLLGEELACHVGSGQRSRYVQGVVTEMEEESDDRGICTWHARLQPRLALLKMGRNLSVYQNITVPDLVCRLLRGNNITDIDLRLHGSYAPHEYCIQYRESDFDFISRLLEQEGIYYFFCQTKDRHTLVLADHPSGHYRAITPELAYQPEAGKGEDGGISSWSSRVSLAVSSVHYKAFSFEQAATAEGECLCNNLEYSAQGISFVDAYDLSDRETLQSAARLKMEQLEAQTRYAHARIHAWWLSCGETFCLTSLPDQAGEYIMHSLTFQAVSNLDDGLPDFKCNASVFDTARVWRPECVTPVPDIPGVLTATVVGPASEDVHTDEYGRIKIQFPWDSENKNDDSSSCWVRVSQPWSGARFGAMFIPRIGSEVVVSFLLGNPDNPLVTGTVSNGRNLPLLNLPGEKEQAGFVSRSSLNGSVEEGHQLRFDDKKGEEKLTLVAQKDMDVVVKNNLTTAVTSAVKETIGSDRSTEITKGNDALILHQGNCNLTLEQGDFNTLLQQGNMALGLQQGNYSLKINGHLQQNLKDGSHSLSISGGGSTIKADKRCVIESTQAVELKVGSSKISITPAGITLSGTTIKIEGTATAELGGAMVTIKGSGMTQVKGGVVMIG